MGICGCITPSLDCPCHSKAPPFNFIGYSQLIDEKEKRIADLEFHKNMQIDENRKVSRRIEELSNIIKEYYIDLDKLHERRPHKCPICDGKGQWFEAPKNEYHCNSCEGKGIVWG